MASGIFFLGKGKNKGKKRKVPFLFDRNIKITVKFHFEIEEGKNKDVLTPTWLEFVWLFSL